MSPRRSVLTRREEGRRFERFMTEVEPSLAARPVVLRFAAVPVSGPPELPGEPLTVWVEGDGEQRDRPGLAGQSAGPAAVLGGSLEAALAECRTAWMACVAPGDSLAPLALERLGQAARLAPEASLLTCDEDELDRAGGRHSPRFRPGPSPDLAAAVDSGSALVCVRPEAMARAGLATGPPGWRHLAPIVIGGPDGAGQAHVPIILVHRRGDPGPPAPDDLVSAALAASGRSVRVEPVTVGRRRVRRPLDAEPSVEVIVAFRDRPELLRRCARSVLERSAWDRLSLCLLDNGSAEVETTALVAELARDSRVRLLRDDGPFNFAALNNRAARSSAADVVVLLNNDTEVLEPEWIEGLVEEAVRHEVGAVAPLLTFPDGLVQHAGAALGLHGYAGHPFAGLAPDAATAFGTALDGPRNWLAVTAACLAVERSKLEAVGGLDEGFVVAGNDVDLGLRLTAAGHRSLCVPHVRLLHDESRSRGTYIDPGDFARSEASYGRFRTVGDPFYNPNLTRERTDCSPRVGGEVG